MLSPQITDNLDYLARIGVLNYDAAADINGSRPRFYGSPKGYVPPLSEPMDYFAYSNPSPTDIVIAGRPFWKVALTGALYVGGALLGGNILLKCCQSIKKGVSSLSPKNWFSGGKKAKKEIEKTVEKGKKAAKKLTSEKSWYKKAGEKFSDAYKYCIDKLPKGKKKIVIKGKKISF